MPGFRVLGFRGSGFSFFFVFLADLFLTARSWNTPSVRSVRVQVFWAVRSTWKVSCSSFFGLCNKYPNQETIPNPQKNSIRSSRKSVELRL